MEVSFLSLSVLAPKTCAQLRTSGQGKRNWLILFLGALAFGGVGIWSMHFVGKQFSLCHLGP